MTRDDLELQNALLLDENAELRARVEMLERNLDMAKEHIDRQPWWRRLLRRWTSR